MTDANFTGLLVILDRSGSMSSIRDDMVGGLETMLADQAKQPGILTVDITMFDDKIEHTHSFASPESVKVVLEPRGSTALFDAMGIGINRYAAAIKALPTHARPANVQVVVITDGQENASREYSAKAVRQLVEKYSGEKYGWDFVFLGADRDAVFAARDLGIDLDKSMYFRADGDAVGRMNQSLNSKMRRTRSGDKTGFNADERRGLDDEPESRAS